ncbi:hypothetical protein FHS32_000311 [Streptomyces albaduncus]|uniref:Uncharacterized protein n=1 Tax=Streptomyces griseoloalbus TaxID=67303 RepID=A0A7W8BLD7_9ACTN|nr:hypothetical protein [Streptomyces albaduncus]
MATASSGRGPQWYNVAKKAWSRRPPHGRRRIQSWIAAA